MKEAAKGYISHGVVTIIGLDYMGWTTGLTQTAKQKLNFPISSVTSLTLLPTASFLEFLEVKRHVHI